MAEHVLLVVASEYIIYMYIYIHISIVAGTHHQSAVRILPCSRFVFSLDRFCDDSCMGMIMGSACC